MTRNGKIARIPRDIRDELNHRLSDGEPGKLLVAWLNAHPDVREVLALYFQGRPVTEQNLSEWKAGGYQDWLRHQAVMELTRTAEEESRELQGDDDPSPLCDRFSGLVASVAVQMLRQMTADGIPETPEGRRELLAVMRELSLLRLGDQRAARLKIEQCRWEEERAEMEEKAFRRFVWKDVNEVLVVHGRNQFVELLVREMAPPQEESFRAHMKSGPRPKPRPQPGWPEAPSAPASPRPATEIRSSSAPIQANPTESDLPSAITARPREPSPTVPLPALSLPAAALPPASSISIAVSAEEKLLSSPAAPQGAPPFDIAAPRTEPLTEEKPKDPPQPPPLSPSPQRDGNHDLRRRLPPAAEEATCFWGSDGGPWSGPGALSPVYPGPRDCHFSR
jgi:hypothetical protein